MCYIFISSVPSSFYMRVDNLSFTGFSGRGLEVRDASDRPGRQMHRNATWPTEEGGHTIDPKGGHNAQHELPCQLCHVVCCILLLGFNITSILIPCETVPWSSSTERSHSW